MRAAKETMIHVARGSAVLITLHAAEQYRSGSPRRARVVLAQDNRCFSLLPPGKLTHTRPRAVESTFGEHQPVSALKQSFELASRATTCQYLPGHHERGSSCSCSRDQKSQLEVGGNLRTAMWEGRTL